QLPWLTPPLASPTIPARRFIAFREPRAMRTVWTYHTAHSFLFGRDAVGQLGDVAARLNIRRLLLVTDPVLLKTGVVGTVHTPLSEAGVSVGMFTEGQPEPSLRAADKCIAMAREFKPEGILGLGGGSNMDLAKITAVVHTHGGTPRDYVGD